MSESPFSIEHALLGFLRQRPLHGYAIHQMLSDPAGLGPVWQIKLSQLYALLGKLEAAGYIAATIEPQENKPPRKIFDLTGSGAEVYLTWVESPVKHGRSLRLEFLVKLYFARQEGAEVTARLLAAQRSQCHDWLAIEAELVEEENSAGRTYGRLVHQFRAGQIRAMLHWLDTCEKEYEHE